MNETFEVIKKLWNETIDGTKDKKEAGKLAGELLAFKLYHKKIEPIAEKYGGAPIDKIPGGEVIGAVNTTWAWRPKANIMKWLVEKSDTDLDSLAKYLGCSRSYLNNKLSRDSFSFDDFVRAAYACGYSITFTRFDQKKNRLKSYVVDFVEYFGHHDPKIVFDTIEVLQKEKRSKREEYERKKAELEIMKKEYGFED